MTHQDPTDTPLIDLPEVLCGEDGCQEAAINMVMVTKSVEGHPGGGVQYAFRCPLHTPAAPKLTPPAGTQ
jgi:hypothetical protein